MIKSIKFSILKDEDLIWQPFWQTYWTENGILVFGVSPNFSQQCISSKEVQLSTVAHII